MTLFPKVWTSCLFALSWMAIYGLVGDWRAASRLIGAVFMVVLFNK